MDTQNHNSDSMKLIRTSERLPAREWEGYFVHNGEYRFGSYDEGEPGQFGRPSWYDKFGGSDLKPGNVSYWLEMDLPSIPDEYPEPELKAPALEHPPLRSLTEAAEDEATQASVELKSCPFCGAQPDPPYTNNVGGTYARIRHQESCIFAFGHPREQWLNGMAFERWQTRSSNSEPAIRHSLGRPCGAAANEAEGITEIPEHVNCPVCLARMVESEGA